MMVMDSYLVQDVKADELQLHIRLGVSRVLRKLA